MYQFPCWQPWCLSMMRQVEPSSYVRVLHASPNAPRVDVYANGNLIARNIGYKRFTPYLNVPSGQYNIKVYAAGTAANPVIDTNVELKPNNIYTAAAIGRLSDIELYPIIEPRVTLDPGKANMRLIHLSPNAPAVDLTLPDGTVLFPKVSYKGVTDYKSVDPGKYTLQARAAGTDNIVLTVPNTQLRGGRNVSVYAVGLVGEKPGLQVLIPLDGNTYLI